LKQELGVNVEILHQSNRLNPYIDWPFHPNVLPSLVDFVNASKEAGVKTKLYYTCGQISNHAVDFFGMAGLNGEILLADKNDTKPLPGPGLKGMGADLMGDEWLEEHVREGYKGGWYTRNPGGEGDASVGDNVTGRFMNYYIEGQHYLFNSVGIAGLYYDGFDGERCVYFKIPLTLILTLTRMGDFSSRGSEG